MNVVAALLMLEMVVADRVPSLSNALPAIGTRNVLPRKRCPFTTPGVSHVTQAPAGAAYAPVPVPVTLAGGVMGTVPVSAPDTTSRVSTPAVNEIAIPVGRRACAAP
jgi:hypothetical protein